jgi:hypothetical protein
MAATIGTTFRNNLLNAMFRGVGAQPTLLYNAGGNGLIFYTGAPPASPDVAATGTALNTVQPLGAAPWGASSNGVIALATPIAVIPSQTLTAGYARLLAYSGVAVMDMVAGLAASGADIIVSTLTFTTGVAVSVTNLSVSIGEFLGTVRFNTALRNAILNAEKTDVTIPVIVFAGVGSIVIYSGAAPATADIAATGTVLATFTTSNTTWNAAAAASCALAANIAVNASATGTAGYARMINGSYVMQMSVGTVGADLTIDSLSLTSGVATTITNATISI